MWIYNNKTWYSEEEVKELKEELISMRQTYEACEKEYIALTKRYHELQGEFNHAQKIIEIGIKGA